MMRIDNKGEGAEEFSGFSKADNTRLYVIEHMVVLEQKVSETLNYLLLT